MAKLKVQQFGMNMHMKMDHGHLYSYSGYIDQPGHPLHGKTIMKSLFSAKKKEESKVTWSVDDGTKEPPTFNTLILLMDHYKLKPVEE